MIVHADSNSIEPRLDESLLKDNEYSTVSASIVININATLEDQQTWDDDFEFNTTDLLEIYIEISRSSVEIMIYHNDKTIEKWDDVTIRFHKKLSTNVNGTYNLLIKNPGKEGGDSLTVEGYYNITINASDEALISLNAKRISWVLTFIEISGLLVCVLIYKKKSHIFES